MIYQLRQYEIYPGKMPDWVALFDGHIKPLHDRLGIPIIGAWQPVEDDTFVWIRGFHDQKAIARLEAAYFSSPERQALGDRPQQLIQQIQIKLMTAIS